MHLGELDDSPMAKGISMIYKQLLQSLNEAGLQPIPTVGQRFDPALHEAVGVVVTDDAERDGEILEEIERGFTFGGKVLRTAKVKVARYFAKP
jgi:molecular chaperone GrpE